jgi:branched-chain amino acid transport system permease protein
MSSFLRRHAGFIVFSAVMLTMPLFTSNAYFLSVAAFAATRLLLGTGLNLLMGQAGQISLGHAAFAGIGAYTSAILTTKSGVNPWLAMLLGAVLAAAVAGLIGMPTLRLRGHYLAMATLGFGEIVYILLVQLKGLTSGNDGIVGIPSLSLGPIDLSTPRAFHLFAWVVALVGLRLALNLSDSRIGRALKGLHKDEVAAASLGVNTSYYKVLIFMVSAVYASIAGSLYAHYVMFISPDSWTLTFSILLVAGVVIGGLGSIWGAVWGTALMMLVPEFLKNFNQDYTNLAFGLLLIVVMIFLPTGLVGIGPALRRGWDRVRAPRGDAGPGSSDDRLLDGASPEEV